MSANFFEKRSAASSSSSSSSNEQPSKKQKNDLSSVPWVEKYRPKQMDEVAHQEEVIQVLKKTLESKNLPHLLFYGPPGTGKTSTILALCRELYGGDIDSRVLELNASDERGIKVVREKIKNFAQSMTSAVTATGFPSPPYKIIILDEADSMTKEAQDALRRTMENHSKITRFCIICNYVTRIIAPLASRCAKFRFKPLSNESATTRLKYICQQESVNIDQKAIDSLLHIADGDLRRAIMLLQSSYRFFGKTLITDESIREVAGVVSNEIVDLFLEVCSKGSFDNVSRTVSEVIKAGFSATQFILQFHDKIIMEESLTDLQKSQICQKIAKVEKCLIEGANEHLQLLDLASFTLSIFNSPPQ